MEKNIVMLLLLLICSFVACMQAVPLNSFRDEHALLAFKAHITSDPSKILATNWSEGTSFCNWVGVSCSRRHQRVTALNLPNMGLRGAIPREVGNLSFLNSIDISENSFHGHLPDELGRSRRLKSIDFTFNEFSGKLPSSFRNLTKLEVLFLSYNNFTGSIARDMGYLPKLKLLYIRNNSISGFIPSTIFNISSLKEIVLTNNQLSGTLPVDMCNSLSKLERLSLSLNQLGGKLPTSLSKCTKLQQISLAFSNVTEYGSAGIVSSTADVYSYGILLMETFTRKKPTDDLFMGELSLKHWVNESFPSEILEVVDANLLRGEEEYFAAIKNCLSSLLGLALECTADLPEERVSMNNVLPRLKKIKITFHENVTNP